MHRPHYISTVQDFQVDKKEFLCAMEESIGRPSIPDCDSH